MTPKAGRSASALSGPHGPFAALRLPQDDRARRLGLTADAYRPPHANPSPPVIPNPLGCSETPSKRLKRPTAWYSPDTASKKWGDTNRFAPAPSRAPATVWLDALADAPLTSLDAW